MLEDLLCTAVGVLTLRARNDMLRYLTTCTRPDVGDLRSSSRVVVVINAQLILHGQELTVELWVFTIS